MARRTQTGEREGRAQSLRKGQAMTRRVRELKAQGVKVTEPRLAAQLGKARSTVAAWKAGKAWPSPAEEVALETLLRLPRGFFTRIGLGVPYEEALLPLDGDTDERSATLRQLAHLLSLPAAARPDGVYSIGEIQRHLKSQISILYRIALSSGVVTEDGLRKANELLGALLTEALRKP